MKRSQRVDIETTGSVFFDLFERGKAERLSIQSGLALALEREIRARKLTQVQAARQLGIAQPRVNDLLRGRLDRFSIDALVEYLSRLEVQVRIATSSPTRGVARRVQAPPVVNLMAALTESLDSAHTELGEAAKKRVKHAKQATG